MLSRALDMHARAEHAPALSQLQKDLVAAAGRQRNQAAGLGDLDVERAMALIERGVADLARGSAGTLLRQAAHKAERAHAIANRVSSGDTTYTASEAIAELLTVRMILELLAQLDDGRRAA